MLSVPAWVPVHRLAVVAALVLGVAAVLLLDRSLGGVRRTLRARLLLGIPWGTLLAALSVLAVYLFVQGGFGHWYAPVVVPFRAWSYFYPLGMVTAAFSHAGPNHLVSNLVGTLTFAPIAEFAYGHFPRKRGASSFSSRLTNPYLRAFVVVPGVVAAVGLLTALFAIGPVIGFSGVVFAFAGFALVHYPLSTVVALSAGGFLRTLYSAFQSPKVTASAEPVYSSPWWADIAIQGHALGLFVGLLLGLWLARKRSDARPTALRIWAGVLLFATAQSMWAVYWYRGGETYVLYRAIGVTLVFVLATLVTAAVTMSDRPLLSMPEATGETLRSVSRWKVAAVVLLLTVAAIGGPAVPINLVHASEGDMAESVTLRDYEITYAENVTNEMVSVVDVSMFGETTNVTTSGVIVQSAQRDIWTTAVTKGRLAFDGQARVHVGGIGWRETVVVRREGWTTVGGPTAYRVTLAHDETNVTAFTAPPAQAEPVVRGRNISVVAHPNAFTLNVTRGNRTASAPIPENNSSVTLDGIEFVRSDSRVYATANGTRVRVAARETYRGR